MWKAIIIDDEQNSRESLALDLNKYCPGVQVLELCPGAKEGIMSIRSLKPDLVFLDVQMPWMSGIEMLEVLGEINFKVIFVTAYDQYALDAFRLSALDYLLKPVNPDDLKRAVEKMQQFSVSGQYREQLATLIDNVNHQHRDKRIALPTGDGLTFIPMHDIEFIEADRNYCTFHLSTGREYVLSKPLRAAEAMLREYDFFRAHHSFLVNLNKVRQYHRGDGGYLVMDNGKKISVARNRKKELLARIEQF